MNEQTIGGVQRKRADVDRADFCCCSFEMHLRVVAILNNGEAWVEKNK